MHCRFFLFFFLFVFIKQGVADTGAWNCEKVEGKEWSCVAKPISGSTETTVESQSPAQSDSETLPTLAAPVPPRQTPVYIQPPKTVARRPGWTCKSAEEEDTWSCNLIGSDPEGKARVISDPNTTSGLLTAAFDFSQEQVFDTLYSQLKYDPWENCTAKSPAVPSYISGKDLRNDAPMDVTADYSEVFDKEITNFFGNVEIIRADQNVLADMASYDTVSETMDAQGHVFYNEDELSLYSDTALLKLGTDEARMRKALFISPSAPIRGTADVVYRDSKTLSRYKEAAFTSCRPGNQDWVVHAERLKMNKKTGKASAKHAWLEFKGLPVLYTPYISFPLDDRRLSGFLPPTFGSRDETLGYDTVIPYYWNIAPNYDLTAWARYMSKRGGMLGGEFRYLTKMIEGSLGLEFLPYDTLRQEARFSGFFKNRAQLATGLTSNIDLNYISDDEYFDELNNALGISRDRHIRSQADISYQRQGISLVARSEVYQTIDKNIVDSDKPYQKIPQVNLDLDHSFEDWPIDLAMNNEYAYFFRNGKVSGHRFNTKPSIAFPIKSAAGFFKPKFSLQHTQYSLTDQVAGMANNISRTLPIFSADSGLYFEKPFELANSKYLHTIEPRLFYLYIPEKDQSDIPAFDSSAYDFGYSNLFRENRFSSVDRVQDANQLTMAMTTRLIDSDSGQEYLNLSVGQIFYFRDRTVTLTGAPETNDWSNLVAELNGQLTDSLSFRSSVQWNHEVNDFTRGQAELTYKDESQRILNLGYRYRRDNPEDVASIIQTDSSIRWPIYDNWYGVARWQYSLKFNSTKESFLGLEKESCCWRFRVIWRRFTTTLTDSKDEDNEMDQGIFVQLELKGLTSFGDKVDDFLEKNLKGYRREE